MEAIFDNIGHQRGSNMQWANDRIKERQDERKLTCDVKYSLFEINWEYKRGAFFSSKNEIKSTSNTL
jgi:hypothetical protein